MKKISDAMREGAKKGPQLFGRFTDEYGGTCAIGAVTLGLKCSVLDLARELYVLGACPTCGSSNYVDSAGRSVSSTLWNTIVHLNDQHRWTREAIADWVEDTFEGGAPKVWEPTLAPERELVEA